MQYEYDGKTYTTIYALRSVLPNIGIPETATAEQLKDIGVTSIDDTPTADEIAAMELDALDASFEKLITAKKAEIVSAEIVDKDEETAAELRAELEELYAEYDERREAI